MDKHFEMGLEHLRQTLLLMASRAEAAVNDSVQSLMQRNRDLALKVRAEEDIIDQFEIEMDELAIQLLTKAPLASNLRLVTVAMKVSQAGTSRQYRSLPNSAVEVMVEIQARVPGGVADQVVRTVAENCRTWKFKPQYFERK